MMRFDATIPMFALCMAASCVVRTPTLSSTLGGSMSAPLPVPAPPSSGPSEAPDADTGIIEAGCSFAGSAIKGDPGTVRMVACPRCDKTDNVYGTDFYTSDTPVCAAAMHAGMISDRGGQVTVVLEPGRPAYRGSKRHGITSHDWGAFHGSYRFEGARVVAEDVEARPPLVVDAGCTFEGNQIHGEPGTRYRVSCPAGCKADTWVAGTDTYSGNTRICGAAIHAGLSSDESGGEFTLILGDKRPAFRGSKRNGVESHDWGEHGVSFQLKR